LDVKLYGLDEKGGGVGGSGGGGLTAPLGEEIELLDVEPLLNAEA
jgi:hypothetical protein